MNEKKELFTLGTREDLKWLENRDFEVMYEGLETIGGELGDAFESMIYSIYERGADNNENLKDAYSPYRSYTEYYKALSVCRMNLVPMCGVCNYYKNAKPYTNFIHCYYESLPTTRPFLVAKVHTVKQRFVVRFDFDSTAIADANLEHRLRYQEKEIRLFQRLKKESVVFINTLCRSCEAVDTPALKIWLGRRLDDYECMHKKNDWRCAVIRGLIAYPGLDITLIQYNRANPVCVNAGGA